MPSLSVLQQGKARGPEVANWPGYQLGSVQPTARGSTWLRRFCTKRSTRSMKHASAHQANQTRNQQTSQQTDNPGQTKTEAGRQTNNKTIKQPNRQASKQTNKQTSKQANKQTSATLSTRANTNTKQADMQTQTAIHKMDTDFLAFSLTHTLLQVCTPTHTHTQTHASTHAHAHSYACSGPHTAN